MNGESLIIPVLGGLVLIGTVSFFVYRKDDRPVVTDEARPAKIIQEDNALPTYKEPAEDEVVPSVTPDAVELGNSVGAAEMALPEQPHDRKQDRLHHAATAEWVKGNYKYEMSLNSIGRLDILTALLLHGGPAKRSDLNLSMSDSVFHRHTMRLRQTGLLVSHGAGKGMRYSIYAAYIERLSGLLLTDNVLDAGDANKGLPRHVRDTSTRQY